MTPNSAPDLLPCRQTSQLKTYAFVEPRTCTVLLDPKIAELRGLRGFRDDTLDFSKGGLFLQDGKDYYVRRSRVDPSDRSMVQVSISHDGDYASAVCIATEEEQADASIRAVVDSGEGLPLHEPEWDDQGFYSLTNEEREVVQQDNKLNWRLYANYSA